MGSWFEWFVVALIVFVIFNVDDLPKYYAEWKEKVLAWVDTAKQGSETVKSKIEKVKTDIDAKKNAPKEEDDENTSEEIEEGLKFMGNFIKNGDKKDNKNGDKK